MLTTAKDPIWRCPECGARDCPKMNVRQQLLRTQACDEAGWRVNYEYLGEIDDEMVNEGTPASLEQIEAVILAISAIADRKKPMNFDRIIRAVAELPDRTSPDDQPEMMLVTADELAAILRAHGPEVGGWVR